MKKIVFKVNLQKEYSVVSLLKEVNQIYCRIRLDLKNGVVEVENVKDHMIDNVVELINNYYTIEEVCIDNTTETTENNNAAEEKVIEITNSLEESENQNDEIKREVLSIQPEDEFPTMKVDFPNEYVQNIMSKFLKTAYWLVCQKNIPENEFGRHIYTCINEMSMRYGYKEPVNYSVGDIVECDYGTHLAGEINGSSVASIVCDIAPSGMPYLVPITKPKNDITSPSHLNASMSEDVIYDDINVWEGHDTVILKKGKEVNSARVAKVIGKTSPQFFGRVLELLATGTFDFRPTNIENGGVISQNIKEKLNQSIQDQITEKTEETVEASSKMVVKRKRRKSGETPFPKTGGEEEAILEVIGSAFEKLDKSKSISDQVDDFLTEIEMSSPSASNFLIKQSFEIACDIKKINYENVILELRKLNPTIREEIIKASLKENFKIWLKKYPELAEKCPKISVMSLLKLFAKRISKDTNC